MSTAEDTGVTEHLVETSWIVETIDNVQIRTPVQLVSYITRYESGRQDVTIHARPLVTKTKTAPRG